MPKSGSCLTLPASVLKTTSADPTSSVTRSLRTSGVSAIISRSSTKGRCTATTKGSEDGAKSPNWLTTTPFSDCTLPSQKKVSKLGPPRPQSGKTLRGIIWPPLAIRAPPSPDAPAPTALGRPSTDPNLSRTC